MELNKIYEEAGLDDDEIFMMESYLEGVEEFHGTDSFDKLHEYFAFDIGEMPYDVVDSTNGDPDVWILNKLLEIRDEE